MRSISLSACLAFLLLVGCGEDVVSPGPIDSGDGADACGPETCNSRDVDCDGNADEDFDLSSDPQHCGQCQTRCEADNGVLTCADGVCGGEVTSCDPLWADCDESPANGCEQSTATTEDCGACGVACALPNGEATCESGTCELVRCVAGYDDCDGNTANGCETPLSTLTDCGACGVVCDRPNGTAICNEGICQTVSCDMGYEDCNHVGDDGCEQTLTDVASCGGCGMVCAPAHAAPDCSRGLCEVATCESGWGDCNFQDADGCERSLQTLTSCGGCGTACVLPHAIETCTTGACAIAACEPGWDDCDDNDANGCETSLATANDCGACGSRCMLPHGVSSCTTGTCALATCDRDYADCNANPMDGCEVNLTTLTNCGRCGVSCSFANATESCDSGACVLSSCDTGFANCDYNVVNGCEAPTTVPTNCGACGRVCGCVSDGCDGVQCTAGLAEVASGAAEFTSTKCARKTTGELYCWGANNASQLGLGDTTNRSTPTLVPGSWRSVQPGPDYTCGIQTNGSLWCWGANAGGQLGSGDTTPRMTPTRVGTENNWSTVSTGAVHACAIKTDRSLWCWGANAYGQLGTGPIAMTPVPPVRVGTASDWSALSLDLAATYGVRADGTLWAWGQGFLGDDTNPQSPTPRQVGTATNWRTVAAAYLSVSAVNSSGELWTWGWNGYGQLGLGDTTDRYFPTRVGTASWLTTSRATWHACGVQTNGSLWCWGRNGGRSLGLGDFAPRNTPTRVGALSSWASVDASQSGGCALEAGGTLWCWGTTLTGDLGFGASVSVQAVPARLCI